LRAAGWVAGWGKDDIVIDGAALVTSFLATDNGALPAAAFKGEEDRGLFAALPSPHQFAANIHPIGSSLSGEMAV
jgi:hypothetical protein